jgi:hypothetical protein
LCKNAQDIINDWPSNESLAIGKFHAKYQQKVACYIEATMKLLVTQRNNFYCKLNSPTSTITTITTTTTTTSSSSQKIENNEYCNQFLASLSFQDNLFYKAPVSFLSSHTSPPPSPVSTPIHTESNLISNFFPLSPMDMKSAIFPSNSHAILLLSVKPLTRMAQRRKKNIEDKKHKKTNEKTKAQTQA